MSAFVGPAVMRSETCAALSAVFALLLVTVAAQHRRAIRKVRRRQRVFNWITDYSMMFALGGLVVTVVGVQVDGLAMIPNLWVWIAFGFSVAGMTFMLVNIIEDNKEDHASDLIREQQKAEAEQELQRLAAHEDERPGEVWWRRLRRLRATH